jgi:hypothetical protein
LGVERVGLSATAAILDEAKERGVGEEPVEIQVNKDSMSKKMLGCLLL